MAHLQRLREAAGKGPLKGDEHDVFHDVENGLALKLTKPGQYGAKGGIQGYLNQAAISNEVFDDHIRVEGMVHFPGEDGSRLVTTSPWITGHPATLPEIDTYMRRKGFQRVYDGAWIGKGDMLVTDALERNVMIDDRTGDVHPVDLLFSWPQGKNLERIEDMVNAQPQPEPPPLDTAPVLGEGRKSLFAPRRADRFDPAQGSLFDLLTPAQQETKAAQPSLFNLSNDTDDETRPTRSRTDASRAASPSGAAARPAPRKAPQPAPDFGELFAPRLASEPTESRPRSGRLTDRPSKQQQQQQLEPDLFAGQLRGSGSSEPAGTSGGTLGGPLGLPTDESVASHRDAVPGSPEDPANVRMPAQERDQQQQREPQPSVVAPRPPVGDSRRNFHAPESTTSLAPAGNKAKIEANLRALTLLKQLEDEGRNATPEEKAALAAYTGWGAFKEAFNEDMANRREEWAEKLRKYPYYAAYKPKELTSWEERHGPTYDLLREQMTEPEFRAASRSTLNAHYTAAPVIKAMWKMAEKLGFTGGRALEPSAGAGHFLGMQPEHLANQTQWQTVELDDLTARLLSKLYPEATVNESLGNNPAREIHGLGFERARIPNGSQDLIISNVPFHASGPRKKGFPTLNLHNFFFAHAMDKVKPGGLVSFVTSESTMQNNPRQREFLASKGDLVAAYRLPNNAFKANAGTEVTTDILIFRKRDGTPFKGQPWQNLKEVGRQTITLTQSQGQLADEFRKEAKAAGKVLSESRKGDRLTAEVSAPILVNEYFVNHPDHVLGEHTLEGSMYRPGQYAVAAPDGLDVASKLEELADKLPSGVMGRQAPALAETTLADAGDKPFSLKEQNGKIYEVQPDRTMTEVEWSNNPAEVKTYQSWKKVADAAANLVERENTPGVSNEALQSFRDQLNRVYDAHVAQHGAISRRYGNKHDHLEGDPAYPLTAALEEEKVTTDSKGKKTYSYLKAPIFKKRIVTPIAEPTTATDANDAIDKSLAWKGKIDPEYAAKLLGTTPEAFAQEALQRPDIFENPDSSLLETGENYLSGNVRQKLAAAEEAAKTDPKYQKNVEALTKAQPEPRTIATITPVLGARWIPSSVYNTFIREVLHGNDTVEYIPAGNSWRIDGSHVYRAEDFTTERKSAASLFEHALNMSEPMVYDRMRDGSSSFNAPATAAAKAALEKMKQAFVDFVKTSEHAVPDPELHSEEEDTAPAEDAPTVPVWKAIETAYNTTNNAYVTPTHTGEYLQFPGLNTDYVYIRPHRRAVIARFLAEQRGMMAHGVGSGKTFNQIILAHEMRRLGLARKTVIGVQNSTLTQFAASYLKAYPSAKILVPSKADFQAKNRKRLVAKIATGDYEAVILPHSQFDLIANKPEAIDDYLGKQIDELRDLVIRSKRDSGKKTKVSDLESMLKKLEERRQGMLDDLAKRQDDAIFWEDLGVDGLIMDEAHNYKSLPIITRMGRVKGVPASTDSQRAIGFMLKVRDVQKRANGRNVFTCTGTPIKNSMAEAFIHMQYLAPDILQDFNIHNFDDFATTFGATESKTEMSWGGTPKVETRFAKFQNGPSLITMIRSVFDVAMGNAKLGLDVPEMEGGGPEMVITPATPTMDRFNQWVRSVAEKWGTASGAEKEAFPAVPIMTLQAGIAAAVDPRLIAAGAPDHPESKLNHTVRRVAEIYRQTGKHKAAQAIFCDLRNPFKLDYLLPFTGHPFAEYADAEAHSGEPFDIYKDIQKKLIAAGIPANEIHLMQSGMKDTAKAALFDKVNRGDIRVILGSTELLGVGVNIQERLKAIHHLSPPRDMTPAMNDQRNGRLIRQGNMHAAKVEGQPAWNEPVNNVQYGVAGSTDAAIYGTMGRKSKFIAQLLMGEIDSNTFDDPTDSGAISLAEMAARTMGDADFIRRIELEKELAELRIAREAHTGEQAARRSRLDSKINRERLLPGWIDQHAQVADVMARAFQRSAPRPEGVKEETDISDKPVYQFGTRTIDTAAKDNNKITEPLDLWLLDESQSMEKRGQKLIQRPLIVNGTEFQVEIHTTMPGSSTGGRVLYQGTDLGPYSGAGSLIARLRGVEAKSREQVTEYEQQLPVLKQEIHGLQEALAKNATWPDEAKLNALETEMQEVDARLNAKAEAANPTAKAPAVEALPEGHTRPEKPLPPLQAVNPRYMTEEVADILGNSKIEGNRLVLPPNLDRKTYLAVNQAIESAGGRWDRRAEAHLFQGDPTKALFDPDNFTPAADPPPLATASRWTGNDLQNPETEAYYLRHARPDPLTGQPSLITGPTVSPDHARAIYHASARAVAADSQAGRGGNSPQSSPPNQAQRQAHGGRVLDLAQFGFPGTNPQEKPTSGPLKYIGGQAEGTVYADPAQGVVYKFLHNYAGEGHNGATPQVYYTADGRLDYALTPARTDRHVLVRYAVQNGLGGTPTEVLGKTAQGHWVLKQPLSTDPELSSTTEGLGKAIDKLGAVELPRGMVKGNLPVYVANFRNKPWFITDLRGDNFVADTQGQPRANDLLITHLDAERLAPLVPGLQKVIDHAASLAVSQSDRTNRLFSPARNPQDRTPAGAWAFNHLDKLFTGQVAKLSQKLASTPPAQALATVVGNSKAGQFFGHTLDLLRQHFTPLQSLAPEALAMWREMNVKSAFGKELAMDVFRSMEGKGRFTQIAYPEGFKADTATKRQLYLGMTGGIDPTTMPPELQQLAKDLRGLLVNAGKEAVAAGRMSLDTFNNLTGTYLPHYYAQDQKNEAIWTKAARVLGIKDVLAQRTTAWHIVDTQTTDPRTGRKGDEGALVNWDDKGSQWRFRSQEHRDAFYKDFINDRVWDSLKNRSHKPLMDGLSREALDHPETLSDYQRGTIRELTNQAKDRYKRKAPLTIDEQEKAGLLMDPVYSVVRYLAQMHHDNAVASFFNSVAGNPAWTTDSPAKGYTAIPDTRKYGRLAGKYVQDGIARQVLDTCKRKAS
jgi:N12 class adenine-specific DNA methylase